MIMNKKQIQLKAHVIPGLCHLVETFCLTIKGYMGYDRNWH